MNKDYIYKQLYLMEYEIKDVYDTMVEHKFELTKSDVQSIRESIKIRVKNIKRELNFGGE